MAHQTLGQHVIASRKGRDPDRSRFSRIELVRVKSPSDPCKQLLALLVRDGLVAENVEQ